MRMPTVVEQVEVRKKNTNTNSGHEKEIGLCNGL